MGKIKLIVYLLCLNVIFANPLFAGGKGHSSNAQKFIEAGRQQIGVTLHYDPAYKAISYPLGDISLERGVCTDVIIRALRVMGVDLQKEIHLSMRTHRNSYPNNWGLARPDVNIDHRRVPNIVTYFRLRGFNLPIDPRRAVYLPGDIVVWDLGRGVLHIGILGDTLVANSNRYKVIHNICCGVKEEDIFDAYKIVGHYRLF